MPMVILEELQRSSALFGETVENTAISDALSIMEKIRKKVIAGKKPQKKKQDCYSKHVREGPLVSSSKIGNYKQKIRHSYQNTNRSRPPANSTLKEP